MPEAQTYSDFFQWLITRKASSTSEVRDWYAEYSSFVNEIDADIKLNRIKAVFLSDTTPETLVEANSNSLIFNGTVLATQVYNLPEIDADNVGMIFRVASDTTSNAISLLRTGSDVIYVNGSYHGTAYSVSGTAITIVARALGIWEVSTVARSLQEAYNGGNTIVMDAAHGALDISGDQNVSIQNSDTATIDIIGDGETNIGGAGSLITFFRGIDIFSDDVIAFEDSAKTGSGYATSFNISTLPSQWDDFETRYGEADLIPALNEAYDHVEDHADTHLPNGSDPLISYPRIAAIGDSRTVGRITDAYTLTLINDYGTSRNIFNYGVNGMRATQIVNYPLLKAVGQLRWFFRTSRYPFLSNGISIAIVDETLEFTYSVSGYAYLACLPAGQEVKISGYYTSTTAMRLRIATSGSGDILTTTTTGDFEVNYTPLSNGEEIQIGISGGADGDKLYLRELKIELVDRSSAATESVLMWAGINDIIADLPASTIQEAMQFHLDQITQAGVEPVFMKITQFGASTSYTPSREAVRKEVNDWTETTGYPVVDTEWVGSGIYIRSEYDYGDGLHMNALGYVETARLIQRDYFGDSKGVLDLYPTVDEAIYTVAKSNKVIFVERTNVEPVTIIVPDDFVVSLGYDFYIKDIGNATVNNITIKDESGNEIAIIRGTGDSYHFFSNGTELSAV